MEDEENSEISLKGLSKLVTENKLNCASWLKVKALAKPAPLVSHRSSLLDYLFFLAEESGEGFVVMQRVVMKQRSDSRTNTPKKRVLVPMFKK